MNELESKDGEPVRVLENWVVFSVTGENFNPDVVTMELGIEPDRVIRPGPGTVDSIWQINSSLGGQETLEAHFWQILRRLLPVREGLLKIAREARLNFYCTVRRPTGQKTALSLSPRLLLLIGYIGAGFDFEISDRSD